MSARDDMLEALEQAQARRREQGGGEHGSGRAAGLMPSDPAALSGFSRAVSASYHESLIGRFMERLVAVKGEAYRAADSTAVGQVFREILERWKVTGVALAPDPLVVDFGLAQQLQQLKIPVQMLDAGPGEQAWRQQLAEGARERREPAVPWDLALTGCEGAIAETGSVVHRIRPGRGRGGWLLCKAHLVLLDASQLVTDLEELFVPGGALDHAKLPRAITVITGPSRTADIEQTLTVGVHGPGRFGVIVVG